MNRPTLYQFWLSSASWRVRWALAIKGVAYEPLIVDLMAGAQREPAYRARVVSGRVPALVVETSDGPRTLSESVAIIEYLEETIPEPPLYPKDPIARARVRQLVEIVNSGTQPMQNLVLLSRFPGEGGKQIARDFNERGLEIYEDLLDALASEGLGGRFSVGDRLTAADLFLVPQVASARRFGVEVARFPRVLAVEAAARATPHAEAARPEHQPGAPVQAP